MAASEPACISSATFVKALPSGARELAGLASSSSMPLTGHNRPMPIAASAVPAPNAQATAHHPRDGGRPEGNSRPASTSNAMLGYEAAAESQAAVPPRADQGVSASA